MKKHVKNGIILCSIALFLLDSAYKLISNINFSNRTDCFLYRYSSKLFFMFYENFIELWIIMIFGVFIAVLLKRSFMRIGRFYPRNPLMAVLYAAILPLCACSTIPFLSTLMGKINNRTMITFLVAEPLLSPTILMLSFSVLGVKYGVLRILCAFFLAMGAGCLLEFANLKDLQIQTDMDFQCDRNCGCAAPGLLDETWNMTRQLAPYFLLAGILGCLVSWFQADMVFSLQDIMSSWYGKILAVFIGIPIYVCNGGDIFLLRALVTESGNMPYGTMIAFSLSASAVCLPSIVLLTRVLGKKNTGLLVSYIFAACLLFAFTL